MQEVVGSTPIFSTKAHKRGLYIFIGFTVYIIYSNAIDQFYIGHTENLSDRLFRHNNSGSKATKKATDWTVVYKEEFETRDEAYRREMEIKKKKSRNYITQLISFERPVNGGKVVGSTPILST